jgi:hypothetical protein
MNKPIRNQSICTWLAATSVALLSFLGGLLAGRVIFEWLFPSAAWLGQPGPAVLIALLFALVGLFLWNVLLRSNSLGGRTLRNRDSPGSNEPIQCENSWKAVIPFLPWLLGPIYLAGNSANLIGGRFLLFGCLWLSAVLLTRLIIKPGSWKWLGPLFLIVGLAPIYWLTMGRTVGTADTFEFQVVVPELGIVHPTGYPLYLLLTKPFTYLPFYSVAWRVNLATALYGLVAVCFIFWLLWRIQSRPVPALLAALLFGLSPTFWSQAVQAEVYTLHALIVAAALLVMREIGGWRIDGNNHRDQHQGLDSTGDRAKIGSGGRQKAVHRLGVFLSHPYGLTVVLALVLGLGLTNHLTTVILLPAAILTVIFSYRAGRYRGSPLSVARSVILVAIAFLLPLFLYAYLPIRWSAVNEEPMGFNRFVDWVIGGRFQGALQLRAWIEDTARYRVVGRIIESEWQPTLLLLISFAGALWSLVRSWRYSLILALTWLGTIFYGLNYYVPDLAVFLIPAFMILVIWWGIGLSALVEGLERAFDLLAKKVSKVGHRAAVLGLIAAGLLVVSTFALVAWNISERWSTADASHDDGSTDWARGVLSLPVENQSAILADSDKFPPLYYLQQVEGLRPDLDILLLPDEAAYRNEMTTRLEDGQNVYLARYLPGLEGLYSLRSEGPITRVDEQPSFELPDGLKPSSVVFGPIKLMGYSLDHASSFRGGRPAVTLYWTSEEKIDEVLHVYLRLVGQGIDAVSSGKHPANNYYPTVAWKPGEIIADFHSLPDISPGAPVRLDLQVALGPPFSPSGNLDWKTVTSVTIDPVEPDDLEPLRMKIGPIYLDGISIPKQARPHSEIPILVTGTGIDQEGLVFELRQSGQVQDKNNRLSMKDSSTKSGQNEPFIHSTVLTAPERPGLYDIVVSYPGQEARCGWLARETDGCAAGSIEIAGLPLPAGAFNFDDTIALISVDIPEGELSPGGQLGVNLQWQGLTDIDQDFTIFVQILDRDDNIVGQADSWPLQGTFPTSHWQPGERVSDPYIIQLAPDLPPGRYRLHIGLYLLETLQRLPIVDDTGLALDDKVVISGLSAP